jgi:hypothetical protein
MTTKRVVLAAPAAVLASILASCHQGEVATPADAVTAPPAAITFAPEPSSGASTHDVDPAEALLGAAQALQLSEMQRVKVNMLKDRLAPYEGSVRAALDELREDVARQVRAGSMEATSIWADENRAAGALTVHVDEEAQTINALYAALDPSQRAEVVATVRANQPGSPLAQPAAAAGAPPSMQGDPFLVEQRRRLDAVLTGFAGSYFDAWTTVPAPLVPPAEALRRRIEDEIAWLEKVLPAMGRGQREQLAATILTRPFVPLAPGSE